MAPPQLNAIARVCTFFGAIFSFAIAQPQVAFPFNNQVPPVARVGVGYKYQLAASTFVPSNRNMTYSLSGQPSWLSLRSADRVLFGTPGQMDAGEFNFTITAADGDGTAAMPCTLVVSVQPAPRIEGTVGNQLARTANLSSNNPATVVLVPSTKFEFDFIRGSFIDVVERRLYYYATLSDHTPLPAWVAFNSETLMFSGTAPELTAFPQSWDIELIVSDVVGFAGSAAVFRIAVNTQQLVFVPEEVQVNITADMEFDYAKLASHLFLNGRNVSPSVLKSAKADVPDWLTFNQTTLSLTGLVPNDPTDQKGVVTVADTHGSQANVIINLVASSAPSLFVAKVGVLTAYVGQRFAYHFSASLFESTDVILTVTLPESARWLHYSSTRRSLSGTVPSRTRPGTVIGTLTARAPHVSSTASQIFTIDIKPARATTGKVVASATPTSSHTAAAVYGSSRSVVGAGVVAAIVLGVLMASALLGLSVLLCCRRRKSNIESKKSIRDSRVKISRPLRAFPGDDVLALAHAYLRGDDRADGAKTAAHLLRKSSSAPQLTLELPSGANDRRSKLLDRLSHASFASSIGAGEHTIMADPNIPKWRANPTALNGRNTTYMPAQTSYLTTKALPEPRFQPMRGPSLGLHQSQMSIGLGIRPDSLCIPPRHTSRRFSRNISRSVSIPDRASLASASTRGTSLLSIVTSDFPKPSNLKIQSKQAPKRALTLAEARARKSIRLVQRSDSSTTDTRSMLDKRQSFIRNRASSSYGHPLYTHASGGASQQSPQRHLSASTSSNDSKNLGATQRRSALRHVGHLPTFRESATSTESGTPLPMPIPERDPRRPSAHFQFSFAPNFPRAVTQSGHNSDDDPKGAGTSQSSSEYYTTSSSVTEVDLAAQLALPRHMRSWVLPGEASPTPPPNTLPPPPRASSAVVRQTTPFSLAEQHPEVNYQSKQSENKSSSSEAQPLASRAPQKSALTRTQIRYAKAQRRDVLSNLLKTVPAPGEVEKARPENADWEDAVEGAGLVLPDIPRTQVGSQRSDLSGPAFL